MEQAAFIFYGSGGFLAADALGNLGTAGHNWGLELFLGLTLLFVGGMAHLAHKGGN
jgi:hypothetical protein